MKASIWAMSSLRLVKDAPLSDFADRIENQISIWLSQEAWVGGTQVLVREVDLVRA